MATKALQCLKQFKLPYLTPYEEQVGALLSDSSNQSKLRDQLVLFSLHAADGAVAAEHRAGLVPLLARVVYGRLIARAGKSKSARDSPATRRAAILAFVGHLGRAELGQFVYLMLRPFVPFAVPLCAPASNAKGAQSEPQGEAADERVVEAALEALRQLKPGQVALEGAAGPPPPGGERAISVSRQVRRRAKP